MTGKESIAAIAISIAVSQTTSVALRLLPKDTPLERSTSGTVHDTSGTVHVKGTKEKIPIAATARRRTSIEVELLVLVEVRECQRRTLAAEAGHR